MSTREMIPRHESISSLSFSFVSRFEGGMNFGINEHSYFVALRDWNETVFYAEDVVFHLLTSRYEPISWNTPALFIYFREFN